MPVIRSVRQSDLDALVELAGETTFGLTTLPPDPERLEKRIEESRDGEAPLLVMIDPTHDRLVGTAGLLSHVGDSENVDPFYTYRLERSIHRSETLDVRTEVDALHLVQLFDGPTEIGTLFLHPDYRGGGNGRILSLSRFMLIARHPDRFDRQVIAEMRGVIDPDGSSPFWEGIGRHFFQVDFPIADILSSKDKRFIAELMPKHPIYVPLLPADAQQVIGQVHELTLPARKLLESEGFHFARMVDIFDGGPVLRCDRNAIRTVKQSVERPIAALVDQPLAERPDTLLATVDGEYLAIGCATRRSADSVTLSRRDAEQLGVDVGQKVLAAPLRGPGDDFWTG